MTLSGIRALLVEDDGAIVRALSPMMAAEGAQVSVAANGKEARRLIAGQAFDLVVLDLGLPDMDGTDLIPILRERSDAPIVVLSARGREADRIASLDLGADDFIGKPYLSGELLARIRAALRRRTMSHPDATRIRFDGLNVDLKERRAFVQDQEIRLSRREHDLLCFLAQNPGAAMTHHQIIDAVWGEDAEVDSQFVRVLVGQLRQKIEADPGNPRLIVTEAGTGYRLTARPLVG